VKLQKVFADPYKLSKLQRSFDESEATTLVGRYVMLVSQGTSLILT
jgi:hypothetical protein